MIEAKGKKGKQMCGRGRGREMVVVGRPVIIVFCRVWQICSCSQTDDQTAEKKRTLSDGCKEMGFKRLIPKVHGSGTYMQSPPRCDSSESFLGKWRS